MDYLKGLLAGIGLGEERVRMFNLSAAMAGAFVEAVKEMVDQVVSLGPNPLRSTGKPQSQHE